MKEYRFKLFLFLAAVFSIGLSAIYVAEVQSGDGGDLLVAANRVLRAVAFNISESDRISLPFDKTKSRSRGSSNENYEKLIMPVEQNESQVHIFANDAQESPIIYWHGYQIEHDEIRENPLDPYHMIDLHKTTGRVDIEIWASQSPPRYHEIHRTIDGRIVHERLDDGEFVYLYGVGVVSKRPTLKRNDENGVIWLGMPMANSKLMFRDDLLVMGDSEGVRQTAEDPLHIYESGSVEAGGGVRRVFGESGHMYEELAAHEGRMVSEVYFSELPRIWTTDAAPFVEESFTPFVMQAQVESHEIEENDRELVFPAMTSVDIPFALWLPSDLEGPEELYYQSDKQIGVADGSSTFENLEQVFGHAEYSEAVYLDTKTDTFLMIRQSPSQVVVPLLRRMVPSWTSATPMSLPIAGKERTVWLLYHPTPEGNDSLYHLVFIEMDDQFLFIVALGNNEDGLLSILGNLQLVDTY